MFVIWFGAGTVPAVLTAFHGVVLPDRREHRHGPRHREPELLDVLRAFGARKRDILLKVGLPRAMPYFFASLKVAVTLAFVGAIISETVASRQGIGLPDDGRDLQLRHAAGFRGPDGDRGDGRGDVRTLRHRLAAPDLWSAHRDGGIMG